MSVTPRHYVIARTQITQCFFHLELLRFFERIRTQHEFRRYTKLLEGDSAIAIVDEADQAAM